MPKAALISKKVIVYI